MSRRNTGRLLDPGQLIEFTRFYGAEVSSGQYPFVDFDEDERWHQRIYRDPRVDIWLISWLPDQGTQLHDHGGSSGAFTVLAGTLTEAVASRFGSAAARPAAGRAPIVRDHVRDTGDSVGFGPHYVHDVRNLHDVAAVSVHAYSPPLTAMTFYDLDGGALVPLRTLATDDPEPQLRSAS